MSVFDQFSENNLPGDRSKRKVPIEVDGWQFEPINEILASPVKHFYIFRFFILLVFGALVFQLFALQISQGSFNRLLAEGNRIRSREITAPRGIIYDRKEIALVSNDGSFALEIYPQDLPKTANERDDFYNRLSSISQINALEIKSRVEEKGILKSVPIVLKENIDRDAAMLLETKIVQFPGTAIVKKPIRNYKEVPGLAQVIGYVSKMTENDAKNYPQYRLNDEIGKEGLEKNYESYLKGRNGVNQIEVDSRGRSQRLLANTPAQPGNNLVLSLDFGLEETISKSLAAQLQGYNSKAGAAVAINPQNGQVLAIVSLPSYNNNIFSRGVTSSEYQELINDSSKPMFNRAVSGSYPSGSTIKPMVAAAGLEEGVIKENTTINDPGEIRIGSYVFPDWKNHGLVDVKKAIAESCNIFFYAIGGGWDKIQGIGSEKLKFYLEKFGLGSVTGIDLPGEVSGLIPSPEWRKKNQKQSWYLGDTYHMSIGQGDVLATPLQMAVSTATIANNGQLYKPYLVDKITDLDGKIIKQNQKQLVRSNFINSQNLQIVREGMRQAVTSGSAQLLKDLEIESAAKTGTAQFGNENKTHAWMIAFAPYNNPEIAIAVIVEGGGEGYAAAGPVIKSAFSYYFSN